MRQASRLKKLSQGLILGIFFVASICYGKHFLQERLFNEVALAEKSESQENEVLLQGKLKKGITILDIPFIENQGQLSEESVRFYANLLDGKILLKDQAIEYVFSEKKINEEGELEEDPILVNFQEVFLGTNDEELTLNFSGKKEFSGPITLFSKKQGDSTSYQLAAFNEVALGEVWPGIEVNLRARGSNVEKIFQVSPGANTEDIRLKFKEGWETSLDEKGKLVLTKAEQSIKFTAPAAFQEIEGEKKEVSVEYSLKDAGYGFQVTGDYDPNYPLVIDPLLASTMIFNNSQSESYLYGGESNAIAIDSEGNVFIAGGDGDNAKIFKLTPDLSQLLAQASLPLSSTGSGEDIEDLKIDDNGDVYAVINYTYSDAFPTVNAYQSARAGSSDAFVAKFDNNLSTLLSATYLGGSSYDFGHSLGLTDSSVYVVGRTRSSNFPVTDGSSNSGNYDGFLTELTKDLSSLENSTYLGGSDSDQINSLYIDSSGKIFITGSTRSSNFPATSGAFQENHKSSADVFAARLNENLSSLEASTFLGGSDSYEYGQEVLIKEDTGDVIITGYTSSSDFPTTSGAFNESINGSSDGFISILNYDLTNLEHSTYIGGSSSDEIDSLTLDPKGNIYTVGTTYSDDIPLAPEPTILETLEEEDFEEATFPPSGWGSWGDESWTQDSSYSQQGSFSAASGNIGRYDESYLVTDVDFQDNTGLIEFYWKVSSEAGYGNDELFFYIDGKEIARISGEQDWTKVSANVSSGNHTFTWEYSKDYGVNSGEDRGWIDNVKFFSTQDPGNIPHNQGEDVFWTQFSPDLASLNYSSYIGGTREDSGHGITLDELGNVFLTGEAYGSTPTAGDAGTNDFPTTPGSFSPEGIVETDIFISKFQSLISHLVVRDSEQNNSTSIQKSEPQIINIIAEDDEENVLEDYQGPKEITLSFDKDATGEEGEVPTCDGVEINGTNPLILDFSQGMASCELEIHKTEEDSPFQLDASDGEIDSHGQSSWDLDISVYEESTPPASDPSCDHFQTSTDDDQLVFEVCMDSEQEKEVEEIEEDEDTGIIRAKIESEDDEEVQGEFTVEEHSSPPSKLDLPSEYQDSSYKVYKYLEVEEDLEEDKEGVEEITFYLEISNQWLTANAPEEVIFLESHKDSTRTLESSLRDSDGKYSVFRIKSEGLPDYLTIIGKKAVSYYEPETEPSQSGACGSAERTYLPEETSFSGEFCSVGEVDSTPNFPSPGESTSWSCQESGTATYCSAYRQEENRGDLGEYEETEEEPQSPPQNPSEPPKSDSNQGLSTFLTNDDVAVAGATTETLESVSFSLAATFIALALAQVLLQTSSVAQLPLVVFNLFSVPAYQRKKVQSGVVYDSQTGQPIPLAQVTIYNMQGKALETKSTDKYGSYFFLVPKGKYQLKIHKKGYQQISEQQKEQLKVTYQDNYFQDQVIDSKQEDFVNPSIPLRATSKSLASSMINQKFIHQIFQVLFYLGFALALAVIFLEPTFFNSVVLLSYLFFFFLKTVNFSRPNWGIISLKNRPQPFAMVSINTKNQKAPLARAITNQSGHYAFILDKGSYQIQAQDNQGKQAFSAFHQSKRSITGLDLNLK